MQGPVGVLLAGRGLSQQDARPMRARSPGLLALAVAVVSLLHAPGAAAADPTFIFSPPDKVSHAWKASAQAGLNVSSGNAQSLSATASGSVSHRSGDDRFTFDAFGAFVRTRVDVAADVNGIPGIGPDEIRRVEQTTSRAWSLRGRYDRFVAERDSLYAAAAAAGDEAAGKKLLAGWQVGYSRDVLRRGPSALTLELGYDLSHQEYVTAAPTVTVQSARLFAGYELTPAPLVGAKLSLELLTNLNAESTPTGRVGSFHDDRLAGRGELNVKVLDRGTLGVRLRAHYDSAPAPRPPPSGTSWQAGYVPLADRLDTTSELVFSFTFL